MARCHRPCARNAELVGELGRRRHVERDGLAARNGNADLLVGRRVKLAGVGIEHQVDCRAFDRARAVGERAGSRIGVGMVEGRDLPGVVGGLGVIEVELHGVAKAVISDNRGGTRVLDVVDRRRRIRTDIARRHRCRHSRCTGIQVRVDNTVARRGRLQAALRCLHRHEARETVDDGRRTIRR